MRNDPSSLGWIADLINESKLTGKQLSNLRESKLLADLFEAACMPEFTTVNRHAVRKVLGLIPEYYMIDLDIVISADATIDTLINQGGYQGRQSSIDVIRQVCSIHYRGNRKLHLLWFKHQIDNEDLYRVFQNLTHMKEASEADLLALGAHPTFKFQQDFPVVAGGSIVGREGGVVRCVLCIHGTASNRLLELTPYNTRWPMDCRFLLVEKEAPA